MTDSKKLNGDAIGELNNSAANYHTDQVSLTVDDEHDSSKVMFLDGKSKNIDEDSNGTTEFVGLRKEELAKYANDPYWKKVRLILLVVFIVAWLAMLIASIIIIALSPRCPPRPQQEWYEKTVIYEIQPLSFQDTNGNGFGDINGIYDRLNYLAQDLTVTTLLLGPVYMSSFKHAGYDVKNHKGTCPGHFGTMDDFKRLEMAVHKKGMKLIMDFIPNHTSKGHKWFGLSENGTDAKYKDYYVWHPGKDDGTGQKVVPNDWLDEEGNPAWTWSESRKAFYYHSYSADQPDLNLRNEAVLAELEDAMTFWLSNRVDGFRVIGAQYLIEPTNVTADSAAFQSESIQLFVRWRTVIESYLETLPKSRRYPRILIAEVKGTPEESAAFYSYDSEPAAHMVTNKVLTSLKKGETSVDVKNLIQTWQTTVPENATNSWQLGDFRTSRVRSRFEDRKYVNALNMLLLTLPGTAFSFYGDELGMKNGPFNGTDPVKADAQLTPMQWNNSKYAGFTYQNVTPWKDVADDYHLTNRQTQFAHGSGVTHIEVFSDLVKMRANCESLQWGKLVGLTVQAENILIYLREAEGFPGFLVAINFGPMPSTVDFGYYSRTKLDARDLPDKMKIVATTSNFNGAERRDAFKNGTEFELSKMIYLEPAEGLVLTWEPDKDLIRI